MAELTFVTGGLEVAETATATDDEFAVATGIEASEKPRSVDDLGLMLFSFNAMGVDSDRVGSGLDVNIRCS